MARIKGSTNEEIFSLRSFGGLNENPDGDTGLKLGEAAVMRNFRISRDGNLVKRSGTKCAVKLAEGNAAGLWSGIIAGEETLLAAAGNRLYRLRGNGSELTAEELGFVNTEGEVHIFAFGGAAYVLDGMQYLCYDGTMLDRVEGYRPLVAVTVPPEGGGELLEAVNKLNGQRRAWFSPDGTGAVFKLPEDKIRSLDYIKYTATGVKMPESEYTADLAAGGIHFNSAPAEGVNSLEIGWSVAESDRAAVEKMRYSELFNGSQDTRVFLYGDGSSRTIYSGLDYEGRARADYFPDMNFADVGDENTPITGMIRHFSKLMVFKTDSAWGISSTLTALADGIEIPAFYVTPINRSLGCETPGQVRLVMNNPRTMSGSDVYEWRNSSTYSAALTSDERQAHRISDRVYATLGNFDAKNCLCFDDNARQEFYICCGERALVNNYASDVWYLYDGIEIKGFAVYRGERYLAVGDGSIRHFSDRYLGDDECEIDCFWESGAMDFGREQMRKYSALLWVSTKPQDSGELTVTVQTDKKSRYSERLVSSGLSSFVRWNFAGLSFRTNRKPTVMRLKIKAKKFVYYKLIFQNRSRDKTASILGADIRVRFTGEAR